MKILSVVGTRPNFMKIAPFINAINTHNKLNSKQIKHLLVHTGQHYENRMNSSFFKSLKIPEPEVNLEIGSGSHAEQVGKTMIAFEKILNREQKKHFHIPYPVFMLGGAGNWYEDLVCLSYACI